MMRHALRRSSTGPVGLKERGYLLVWFSIIVVVLFAIAGMSYDFGQRYYEDTKAQRAADAAALAGVVYRDGTTQGDNNAIAVAKKVAAKNGYSDPDIAVELVESNQVKVTIHAQALNLFANVVGVGAQDFWRSSQAAYDVTTPLGSPSNVLGNEPLDTTTANEHTWALASGYPAPGTSSLWLDIDAPRSPTHSGDQYDATDCTPRSGIANPADNCYDGASRQQTNQDNVGGTSQDGEFYRINKPTDIGGLTVQVFDPTFADTGGDCLGPAASGLAWGMYNGAQWTTFLFWSDWGFKFDPQGRFNSWTIQKWRSFATRYGAVPFPGLATDGNGQQQMIPKKWCTGDSWNNACTNATGCAPSGGPAGPNPPIDIQSAKGPPGVAPPEAFPTPSIRPADYSHDTYDGPAVVTTYTLYQPGTTRDSHPKDKQICSEQFGTYGSDLYQAFAWNSVDHLQADAPASAGTGTHHFQDTFRQWVTLCQAQAAATTGMGSYLLRVQTDVKGHTNPDDDPSLWYANPAEPNLDKAGQGSNKFSLRAGVCSSVCPSAQTPTGENTGLQVSADQRITVAANVGSDNTFFLTKATPSHASRTLTLTFFDPGDLTTCWWLNVISTCDIAPTPGADGTLTIGHTVSGIFQKLDGCTSSIPGGPTPKPTLPNPLSPNACKFSVGSNFNGRILYVSIPLPPVGGPLSACTDAPGNISCWVQAQFHFPSPSAPFYLRPTDVTTWTASINGSPVRLVG